MILQRHIKPAKRIYAVDLFCGAGGLTRGLLNAGIKVRAGIDLDPLCEYPYKQNNDVEFLKKSVTDLTPNEVRLFYRTRSLRLLAGCAPCQTFSTYNLKARTAEEKDKKWFLLLEFARLVTELTPELVTMENVPGLQSQDVFQKFIKTLQDNNYHIKHQVVACADYGIPQDRHRLVLVASRLGAIRLLSPEEFGANKQTVRDAIAYLPHLDAGERSKDDPLHQCSSLSPLNLKRIRASKPGGTWRDWPEDLVAKCHRKATGNSYGSVYGRMNWDEPAPTMTTQFFGFGNGRFGHPEQDRGISLREGAILQSFPPEYEFSKPGDPISMKTIGRLIGNAVPVRLGEVIGKSIVAHVNEMQKQKRS